ncbi:hypothetical protein L3Y34_013736 [Caenorhabditis briggsae]|uniref:Uncharacterized protein n=1 Tax=Caenorhabditis briggsae TaxID=6238 RepID=A0AAE9A2C1_CAEBR|nr:hypothetical protein L3Y34_013736 [Caenorhabditis briggsae]
MVSSIHLSTQWSVFLLYVSSQPLLLATMPVGTRNLSKEANTEKLRLEQNFAIRWVLKTSHLPSLLNEKKISWKTHGQNIMISTERSMWYCFYKALCSSTGTKVEVKIKFPSYLKQDSFCDKRSCA